MYVCVCSEVTEAEINEAIAGGASSLDALRDELGVSICCGSCAWYASELIERAGASAPTHQFRDAAA